MIRQFSSSGLSVAPTQFVQGMNLLLDREKQPAPGSCLRKDRLQSCQLSYFAPHAALSQITTGEEPGPRGKLPPHWLASCTVERCRTVEREGGPLWLGPFQAGLQGRGLSNGIKGSMTEESTHSSFSKQRLKRCRGKVKLCCSFESHPLEINSPFEGITHPTPSWYLGVYQYSNLLSNDMQNVLYKRTVSSPHSPSYLFLLSHEKSSKLKINPKTNKHAHMHTHM